MGKPTIYIGENKGADQLRSNCEADQRLCFRYSESTVPLLHISGISSFYLFSALVQAGLCRTCSETALLVFPRAGSFIAWMLLHTWVNDIIIERNRFIRQFCDSVSDRFAIFCGTVGTLLHKVSIRTGLKSPKL